MKASTVNALSTAAISLGSFLIGGSFGIYFGSRDCDGCPYVNEVWGGSVKAAEAYMEGMSQGISDMTEEARKTADAVVKATGPWDEEIADAYRAQVAAYSGEMDLDGDEVFDLEESYSTDINEITVGEETVQVRETEYGVEEVGEPYIISMDSYEYEYEDFAKEDLVYFEDDQVLVDEKDVIISNVEEIIGSEALSSFGEGSDDEDVVYIRNLRLSIDYRVVREHTSYKENVLGLSDDFDAEKRYEEALEYFNINKKQE